VSLDRKSQDVVFWRCDAGFAQEEVVGQQQCEDRGQLYSRQ
jgi:hypothetical protein